MRANGKRNKNLVLKDELFFVSKELVNSVIQEHEKIAKTSFFKGKLLTGTKE